MSALRIARIEHNSPEYREVVALRYEVLRKPLGMTFSAEQLDSERDALHYAAYRDGTLVATALLLPLDTTRVQLKQMAVSPAMRGAGTGRALIRHIEADAHALGFKEVIADARVSALGFYLKLGYTADGEVYEHVGLPHRKISKAI